MTLHRLPAGTDTAEMALFDIDATPESCAPNNEGLEELVKQERLIRFPTGGDGGYLLHLYIDQAIPKQIKQSCKIKDAKTGTFFTKNGRIAFGGVESTYQNFKPNRFIRSDTTIAPGQYDYTAYHTDIPDEIIEKAIEVKSTSKERWLARLPLVLTLLMLCLTLITVILKLFIATSLVLVIGYILLRLVKRIPGQTALSERRDQAQLEFPSIVIQMRTADTTLPS